MSRRNNFRMTRPMLAGVALGLLILIALGLSVNQCSRPAAQPAAVVADTTATHTVRKDKKPKPLVQKTQKRDTAAIHLERARDRNHLGEVVSTANE